MTSLMNKNHDYCRLCLVHDRSALTVHICKSSSIEIIQQSVTSLLDRYLSFLILIEDDKYSKSICTECWTTIMKFHSFYQRIENAQKVLLAATIDLENVIKDETKVTQLHEYTIPIRTEQNLPTLLNDELAENSLSSCEYDSKFVNIEHKSSSTPVELNNSIFKTTGECLLNIQNEINGTSNVNNCITSIETIVIPSTSSRESKEKPKNYASESDEDNDTDNDLNKQVSDGGNDDDDNNDDVDDDDDDGCSFSDDEIEKTRNEEVNKFKKRQMRPSFEINNARIQEHFKMECSLCQHPFEKYTDARKHFRLIHKKKRGYLTCCGGQKFYLLQQMLDHISVHINPDTFKCKICDKVYRNRLMMSRHMREHDTTIERFPCDKCNKSYPKIYELTKHIRQSHYTEDDKKFNCQTCGKKFLANRMLNDHIDRVHIKPTKIAKCICDICAKEFTTQFALSAHIRVDHLNIKSPKVLCPICNKWITSKKTLRQHMRSHEVSPKKCSLCDTVLKNNNCLQSHLSKVHKEPKFKCTLCSSAFKNAVSLREHIAAHTGQDLYSCPYCSKTFKSNSNLHHHRKRMHEVEFERDRGTRTLQKIIQ